MATVPMDVGAITGDLRSYAKGGGKAVGDREVARGLQLHCRRCGKKGHTSDECHAPWSSCPGNRDKGKGKGKGKGKWAEPKPKAKAALDGKLSLNTLEVNIHSIILSKSGFVVGSS